MAFEPEFRGARRRLVEELQDQGIRDLAVLHAIEQTPRHAFVPAAVRHRAYEDSALPLGNGQTISQPSTHARYLELLRLTGSERVLEIGTGTGYQTVLLSHLASQVFSVERVAPLLERARETIQRLEARNISLLLGDGTLGWREYAPYDAILVSAASPEVPAAYHEQLVDGGRLLIPLGSRGEQTLHLMTRRGDSLEDREIGPVRFVPLVGRDGWEEI
ncbi:MAG TPA: protein-L-isoaspartate(D-aspartate) O-methyltransferase [Gemmatimonadaceae bacterium]|nr:protein-L-isoaspartate(D-aspartate) O-methyltransferase [Gemmatimonadaceae bacterium]